MHGKVTRILLFVNHFDRAGTETQLVKLANALSLDATLEIHVGCHRGGPLLDTLEVPRERIRLYPLHRFYSAGGLRQIARLGADIRRTGFHLVHSQDFYANVMCAAARALAPRPRLIVSRRYDYRPRRVHRWGEWCSYHLADAVVFNSSRIAARVTRDGFLPSRKAVVIPNALSLERFKDWQWTPDAASFRRDGRCRIGAVGRLHPVKGHEILIHAVAALAPRWPMIELVIVGEGPRRKELLALAERLGVAGRVQLKGEVADVAPILPTFDVAVLPSHGEGLPNALLEYMAAGCPIVATRVGGVGDAARHNREAILVPPGNKEALSSAIDALLSNPARCSALSLAARERAQDFTLPRLVTAVRKLYADLIGDSASAPPSTDRAVPVKAG